MNITPEIWKLRAACGDRTSYGLHGIHFDGEYAAATNGSILVAFPCKEPALEKDHVMVLVSPEGLKCNTEIEATPGLHVTRNESGQIVVVEVVPCPLGFPKWRTVVGDARPPTQLFGGKQLAAILEASGLLNADRVRLGIQPGGLGGVMVDGADNGNRGRIAIIMPVGEDQ